MMCSITQLEHPGVCVSDDDELSFQVICSITKVCVFQMMMSCHAVCPALNMLQMKMSSRVMCSISQFDHPGVHVSDDDELPGDVFRHQAARANIPVLCEPVPGQGSASHQCCLPRPSSDWWEQQQSLDAAQQQ